jgi:tetratricopeptide (TPR) repeat protein
VAAHFYLIGEHAQAIAAAQRALTLAAASGEVVLHALANRYLGGAYEALGDYRRAIDCFTQTVVPFEGARRHERFGQVFLPAVLARVHLATCHAELGMFAEGRTLADEGHRMAEAAAHPASLMIATCWVGLLALRQGDVSRALPRLERAVGLCQEANFPVYLPTMATSAGRPSYCGGTWRLRTGSLARPVQSGGLCPGRGWR